MSGITNGIFNLKGVSKKKKDAVTCTVTGQPKAGGGYEIPLVVIALQLQLGSTSRIEYLQLGTGPNAADVVGAVRVENNMVQWDAPGLPNGTLRSEPYHVTPIYRSFWDEYREGINEGLRFAWQISRTLIWALVIFCLAASAIEFAKWMGLTWAVDKFGTQVKPKDSNITSVISNATTNVTNGHWQDYLIKTLVTFSIWPRQVKREVDDLDAFKRFYLVMLPVSRRDAPVRLMSVASAKRVPERIWGSVSATAVNVDDVLKELGPKQNPNLQQGLLPGAEEIGQGGYVVYDDGKDVRLLFVPQEPNYHHQEAQAELGVYRTGDYAIQIKNPWEGSSRTVSLPQRTPYPSAYQKLFRGPNAPEGGYLFIPPRDPTMLDYQDFSFVLIGRSPAWHQEVEPQSVAELLDQADKEDLDPEAYGKGTDDDAAMIDKLRTNGAADRYAMDTPPAL